MFKMIYVSYDYNCQNFDEKKLIIIKKQSNIQKNTILEQIGFSSNLYTIFYLNYFYFY